MFPDAITIGETLLLMPSLLKNRRQLAPERRMRGKKSTHRVTHRSAGANLRPKLSGLGRKCCGGYPGLGCSSFPGRIVNVIERNSASLAERSKVNATGDRFIIETQRRLGAAGQKQNTALSALSAGLPPPQLSLCGGGPQKVTRQ